MVQCCAADAVKNIICSTGGRGGGVFGAEGGGKDDSERLQAESLQAWRDTCKLNGGLAVVLGTLYGGGGGDAAPDDERSRLAQQLVTLHNNGSVGVAATARPAAARQAGAPPAAAAPSAATTVSKSVLSVQTKPQQQGVVLMDFSPSPQSSPEPRQKRAPPTRTSSLPVKQKPAADPTTKRLFADPSPQHHSSERQSAHKNMALPPPPSQVAAPRVLPPPPASIDESIGEARGGSRRNKGLPPPPMKATVLDSDSSDEDDLESHYL